MMSEKPWMLKFKTKISSYSFEIRRKAFDFVEYNRTNSIESKAKQSKTKQSQGKESHDSKIE